MEIQCFASSRRYAPGLITQTPASEFSREYPIRVLVHDFHVTQSLLGKFTTILYDALNAYEYEIVASRQRDKYYGGTFDPAPLQPSQETSSAMGSNQSIQESMPIKTRGGSIYDSLENAFFALELMNKQLLPCIILITDGVATEYGYGSSDEF